ncbi:MAG: cysteine desulfurase family protein [Mucilaginibacter sp.]
MEKRKVIYLDHHATTPVDPRVLDSMLPYFTEIYGNAASIDHDYGYEAKQAVDKAREQIAKAINAQPEEIIFTSGATESDNIALFGVAEKYAHKGKHIITCVTEHKAVLDSCKRLEQSGYQVTYLPVDSFGEIDLKALALAITPETILISVMAANNEIGTIAPLEQIGDIAKQHNILFHSDAAQAIGHIPIDVQKMRIDILSISGHKVYGPKGIGVLYRRKSNPRVSLSPVIYGGGHEKGLRSGTLNVPAIVGIGKAVELACKEMASATKRYKKFTAHIWDTLKDQFPDIQLNGHPERRLPHNLNISIPGVESKALIVQLKDIAVSAGSACTTTSVEPSHVLVALGFGEERAHNSIRISVGRFNTEEDIQCACVILARSIRSVLKLSSN